MLVFNATPLIYLAKVHKAHLLGELPGPLVVPASVRDEVVTRGLEVGEADARRIGTLVDDEVLGVVQAPSTALAKRLADDQGLHEAEQDVLVIADDRSARAVLDEKHGRRIAEAEGIQHGGTIYVLIELVKRGEIDQRQARDVVDAIIEHGWYCSTGLYARIVRKLEEL